MWAITGHMECLLVANLPDVPLIANELKLRREGAPFDPDAVSTTAWKAYMATHSLLFSFLVALVAPYAGLSLLLHQVMDWPVHKGRFAPRPLYPLA